MDLRLRLRPTSGASRGPVRSITVSGDRTKGTQSQRVPRDPERDRRGHISVPGCRRDDHPRAQRTASSCSLGDVCSQAAGSSNRHTIRTSILRRRRASGGEFGSSKDVWGQRCARSGRESACFKTINSLVRMRGK